MDSAFPSLPFPEHGPQEMFCVLTLLSQVLPQGHHAWPRKCAQDLLAELMK